MTDAMKRQHYEVRGLSENGTACRIEVLGRTTEAAAIDMARYYAADWGVPIKLYRVPWQKYSMVEWEDDQMVFVRSIAAPPRSDT